MTITKNLTDTALTIALEGRLDTTSAPRLEAELRQNLNGVTRLDLDFAGLEYISSAGLRVLLAAQKVMQKQGKTMFRRSKGKPANPQYPLQRDIALGEGL